MSEAVEVIGAVEPGCEIDAATLSGLLDAPLTELGHDGAFTGRPTTTLRTNDRFVLKERDVEAGLGLDDLRHRVADTLDRVRLYGVAPPSKTWLLVRRDGAWRIGNIAPRLLPLHLPESEDDPSRFFRHLRTMLQTYLGVAARFRVRLDEGLSNFAYDAGDRLYYVDDDIYPWDDFAHFSQWIGVTIRKVRTLSPKFAQALGQAVRQAIVEGFGSHEPCMQIAAAVRGLYFSGAEQEQRRDGFIEGLIGVTPHSRSRRASAQQRPIALLADVHANYPALSAVVQQLRAEGIERGLVLGDIVGYGPHPAECLRCIRELGFDVVRGNHDETTVTGARVPGFNEAAFKVIDWTRSQLDAGDLDWLGAQPARIERDGWIAQHGAPMDPAHFYAYVYRLTYEDNLRYLAEHGIRWAFHGHTHMQSVYYATSQSTGLDESGRQSLSDYQQALVCPGSVGQPRRGGVQAQWALFNPATTQIEFRSAAYDIEATAGDMVARGFPSVLVERLRAGH